MTITIQVSTATAAKLRHEAARSGKTEAEVAAIFVAEGCTTLGPIVAPGGCTTVQED